MLSIKAAVVQKGEKEFAVVLGAYELGTSKHRFDADLHANVINNALEKARLEEAYAFRGNFHHNGPFDMPFRQLKAIVEWMDKRVSELERKT